MAQSSNSDEVESYLGAAQEAQSAGDIKLAIENYRQVLALQPDYPKVQANLGMMLYLDKNYGEAIKLFRAALSREPDLVAAHLFMGMAMVKLEQYDLAVNPLRQAIKQDPTNADAHLALCAAYSGKKRFEMAVNECIVATRRSPNNADAWYTLGQAAVRGAKALVDNWASKSPAAPYVYVLKAESYRDQEKYGPAILEYQKALGLSPDLPPETHLKLGELFLLQGDTETARKQFALMPKDAEPINYAWGMAQAALGERNYREFDRWEKEIAKVNPDFVRRPPWFAGLSLPPQTLTAIEEDLQAGVNTNLLDQSALRFLGILAGRSSMNKAATEQFNEAQAEKGVETKSAGQVTARSLSQFIRHYRFAGCTGGIHELSEQFQSDGSLLAKLAECGWKSGKFEMSLQNGLKARRASPHQEAPLYWEIKSLLQISKDAFLRLSRLPDGEGHVHELLAKDYEAQGQDTKAVEEYRLALKILPDNVEIRLSLAALQMHMLRYEDAIETFKTVLNYSANDSDAHYGSGVAFVQLHQSQAAAEHLQKALQLNPNWPEAHTALGQAYRQLGQYRQAAAEFERGSVSDVDGSIHLQLYEMYKKVGDEQKAKQALNTSLALREQARVSREKAIRQQIGAPKNE
jgi:tetratricopeptide (TPR) repeat protein